MRNSSNPIILFSVGPNNYWKTAIEKYKEKLK